MTFVVIIIVLCVASLFSPRIRKKLRDHFNEPYDDGGQM
jgi:hypothetical protein